VIIPVAVEKLAHSEFEKNWIVSGSSTNDFQSPRHFLSPDCRLVPEKPSFSTATLFATLIPTCDGIKGRSNDLVPISCQSGDTTRDAEPAGVKVKVHGSSARGQKSVPALGNL